MGPRTELWYLNIQSGRQDCKSHICRKRRELKTVLLGDLSTSFEILGLESLLTKSSWHLARVGWSVQFTDSVLCPYSGNSPAGVKGAIQCDTGKCVTQDSAVSFAECGRGSVTSFVSNTFL